VLTRARIVVCISCVAVLVLAACRPAPTPSPPQQVHQQRPAGWSDFQREGFSGLIRQQWSVENVDTKLFADLPGLAAVKARSKLPETVWARFEGAMAKGENLLFIFMDAGETAVTNNISIQSCLGGITRDPSADATVQGLQSRGIQASKDGTVTYQGRSRDLIKMSVDPALDTYQVVLRSGSCYFVVTLSSEMGKRGHVDDFRTFLSFLHIAPR
jgi:hypothetical protein